VACGGGGSNGSSASTAATSLVAVTAAAIPTAIAAPTLASAPTPAGQLQLSSGTYSTTYSAGTVVLTLQRVGGSGGAAGVSLVTKAGTAVDGQDFLAVNKGVSWAAGDATPKTVSIPLLNHGSFSGSRGFSVGLSGESGAGAGSPVSAQVNISGTSVSATPPVGELALTAASYAATQRATSILLGIARTAGSSGAVSVNYMTRNGTALSGTDYTSTAGVLNWANGDSSVKTVSIPLLSTAAYSGNRSFTLALSSPTVASLGNPSFAAISLTGACPAGTVCSQSALSQITPSFIFKHPATLNTAAQLTKIKNHINASDSPWSENFALMTKSQYCSLNYVDHPIAVVNDTTNPQAGGNLVNDARAAYCLALRYALTGTQAYATAAEKILADWDGTLTGFIGINWYLNPAWSGQMFAEAADLLNSYDRTWTGQNAVKIMFNNIYLPILHKRFSFGNREFAVESGMMAIGVFMEDPAAIYEAVANNISYVPTYVYDVVLDGTTPQLPNYYFTWATDAYLESLNSARLCAGCTNWIILAASVINQGDDHSMSTMTVAQLWASPTGSTNYAGTYISGWSPEIGGRDLSHSEAALVQAVDVAEMAWNQGIDVYAITAVRLGAFAEQLAYLRLGGAIPSDAYGGVLNSGNGINPTYEILANHLINLLGYTLPNTSSLITEVVRNMNNNLYKPVFAAPFPASPPLFAAAIWYQSIGSANWESLTHARLDGPGP
jgi:hypothetical protein